MILNLRRRKRFIVDRHIIHISTEWIKAGIIAPAESIWSATDGKAHALIIVIIVIGIANSRHIAVLNITTVSPRGLRYAIHIKCKSCAIIYQSQVIPLICNHLIVVSKLDAGIIAIVWPPSPIIAGSLINQPASRTFAVWIAQR